jgi:phenylacetate-CoA ligase
MRAAGADAAFEPPWQEQARQVGSTVVAIDSAGSMPSPPPARSAASSWEWPDPLRACVCAWEVGRAAWLAPAELQALAQRRRRALVAFARDRSAFYRDLYAGLAAPERAPAASLPVVTKTMLMGAFDQVATDTAIERHAVEAFVADPARVGHPYASRFAVWTSSGTTGEPAIFVHDADALAVYDALQLLRFYGLGGALASGFGLDVGPLGLGRYALVAATGGHFAGAASLERLRGLLPWMAQSLRVISLLQPQPALLAELEAFEPRVLATYPTVAAWLAREQLAGRLHIRPAHVWTGGECLTPAMRRAVQRAFGVEVRDEYGASEFASIGVGCAKGWLHVNADWVILEAVDERYRPVPPGHASHTVLLTNLANRAQPLIRYDLGDSITVNPQVCACGNRLPAIRVQGRADEVLQLQGRDVAAVSLPPLALTTVLEEEAHAYDFRLEQIGPRALRLHLGAPDREKSEAARAALRAYLERQGLDDVNIDIADEPARRQGPGAKLRRILRAPAARERAGVPVP